MRHAGGGRRWRCEQICNHNTSKTLLRELQKRQESATPLSLSFRFTTYSFHLSTVSSVVASPFFEPARLQVSLLTVSTPTDTVAPCSNWCVTDCSRYPRSSPHSYFTSKKCTTSRPQRAPLILMQEHILIRTVRCQMHPQQLEACCCKTVRRSSLPGDPVVPWRG